MLRRGVMLDGADLKRATLEGQATADGGRHLALEYSLVFRDETKVGENDSTGQSDFGTNELKSSAGS